MRVRRKLSLLFAVIYKVLPDTSLAWRDVAAGAIATAILFNVGKFLISLYLGSSSVTSSFGAAAAFALLLLWIYYSSQIFLIGAEFTRAWADLVHERGPDSPDPQPDDRADQHSGTKGSIGPAKKLEALKSEIKAQLEPA